MTLTIAPPDNVWHKFLAFKTGIGHSVPEVSRIISFFSKAKADDLGPSKWHYDHKNMFFTRFPKNCQKKGGKYQ